MRRNRSWSREMETADGPVRFRIRAGAAHSWSTLLLDSEPGAIFVYRLPTAELELIDREEAERLMATGAFRPWLGPSEWTPLTALPVAGLSRRLPTAGQLHMTDGAGEQPAE